MEPKGFLKSVGKADQIIEAFKTRDELSITELSEVLGYYPSAIYRFVTTLEYLGYVEQEPENGKYRLGLKFLELGYLVFDRMDLRQRVRPVLKKLADACGETANLAIVDAKKGVVVFIDQIESPRDITMRLRVGGQAQLHATALGKVILAYLPNDKFQGILREARFPKLTENTITEPEELRQQLSVIRRDGFAVDNQEAVEGAKCIAAPVRDHTGQVVAAISISALANRLQHDKMDDTVGLVIRSALEASLRLGYKPKDAST
jgi:DNA-binding IclR family transcriptional regulator